MKQVEKIRNRFGIGGGSTRALFDYNLVLIGFMGTGKTTISNTLKHIFSMDVIEMDQIIVQREGMSISEIFEKYGEPSFRDAET